jgi:hypothetical protein
MAAFVFLVFFPVAIHFSQMHSNFLCDHRHRTFIVRARNAISSSAARCAASRSIHTRMQIKCCASFLEASITLCDAWLAQVYNLSL